MRLPAGLSRGTMSGMVGRMLIATGVFFSLAVGAAGVEPLAPIRTVTVGANRELRVNGQPFLPIMAWLQSPTQYGRLRSVGINTFCGNWKTPAGEMLQSARAAGGYGVYAFDAKAVGHSNLLAWLHGDEPDLPRKVYDAKVTCGGNMKINRSNPLEKMFDGVWHSWSVLDPLIGAEVTVELPKPVTVRRISVFVTISKGLAVAKDVRLLADGREILATTLKPAKGEQAFVLPKPATFRRLTLRVTSATPGQHAWGSIGEVKAFDAAGKNVLLSPPRNVPRMTPAELAKHFAAIKQADASRPVFVTFTSYFMKQFDKYDAAERGKLYAGWVKSCDVAGFDVYPIYGWNRPDWIDYVARGTAQLRRIAGPKRPLYAWIETCKGGKYIAYDRQKDVLPRHTRAEVWMALIQGATAIGYFTHAWKPTFTEFNCTAPMQRELKRLNEQMTRLAPAILAAPAAAKVSMSLSGPGACHVKATSHDEAVYVFAQSLVRQGEPRTAAFTIEGLKAGQPIEVVDENRKLKADEEGRFSDRFAPLQEHIYRIGG
jgi:hypothetical protein